MNGVVAAPIMAMLMLIGGNGRAMGRLTLPRSMAVGGWMAVALMLAASIGFFWL